MSNHSVEVNQLCAGKNTFLNVRTPMHGTALEVSGYVVSKTTDGMRGNDLEGVTLWCRNAGGFAVLQFPNWNWVIDYFRQPHQSWTDAQVVTALGFEPLDIEAVKAERYSWDSAPEPGIVEVTE